jgi:hypothetical protein
VLSHTPSRGRRRQYEMKPNELVPNDSDAPVHNSPKRPDNGPILLVGLVPRSGCIVVGAWGSQEQLEFHHDLLGHFRALRPRFRALHDNVRKLVGFLAWH